MSIDIFEYIHNILGITIVTSLISFIIWIFYRKKIVIIISICCSMLCILITIIFLYIYDRGLINNFKEIPLENNMFYDEQKNSNDMRIKTLKEIQNKEYNRRYPCFLEFISEYLYDGVVSDTEIRFIVGLEGDADAKKSFEVFFQKEKDLELIKRALEVQKSIK